MHIQFERSGGFTGMSVKATIDTETLAAQDANELRALIDAAGFFDLPRKPASEATGADQFQYTISVDDAARRHTIETNDGVASEALQKLLRRLTALARSSRR
jgi:hypothetical protein